MNNMKKTFLLTILLFSQLTLFAQSPTTIQCTMSIDEIALAQPYHRDHPKQENTEIIAADIISELTLVYDLLNQGNSTNLTSHIDAIQSSVDEAILLGMNYSMFQADLDFIETLN
jgi:hypothetical protein